MDLLDRFYQDFPDVEINYICGDREFIGQLWLTYLLIDPIVPFRIRIRETDLEKSLFRYGLDHLHSAVNDLDIKHLEFLECLQFFSCT